MSALHRHTTRVTVPARRDTSHAAPKRSLRPAHLGFLGLLVLLALAGRPAWADSIAVVVPTDGLRLRAEPGTDQRALELIPGGTRIAVTGSANADGWYPVVYKAQRGWVMGSFLAFDELTAAAARRATVKSSDGLNLRSAPMETADVVTVLPAGAAVTATGQATTDGWALVQVAEQSGWVSAMYLSFDGSTPPAGAAPVLANVPGATAVGSGSSKVTVRYYHPSFEGSRMHCGGVYRADDATIAATNTWPCGTVLRVCNGAACVAVTVRDKGAMGPNEIDLSAAAFTKLATLATGVVVASAEVVTQ